MIGAAAGFLLLTSAVVLHAAPLWRFDTWLSTGAHHAALSHPAWRAAMYAVTRTANTGVLSPIAATATLLLLWRGWLRQGFFVAVAMVATSGVRLLILDTVARPRPADRLAPAAGWSFPSGHTTASATAALILVVLCWPRLRLRWSRILLVGLAGGWAAAVGVSRVALVVHWPADVVGAWLLVLVVVPTVAVLLRVSPSRDGRSGDREVVPGSGEPVLRSGRRRAHAVD